MSPVVGSPTAVQKWNGLLRGSLGRRVPERPICGITGHSIAAEAGCSGQALRVPLDRDSSSEPAVLIGPLIPSRKRPDHVVSTATVPAMSTGRLPLATQVLVVGVCLMGTAEFVVAGLLPEIAGASIGP